MSKKYGDIFSVRLGSNWCVVLNSLEAAKDAYLKKPVEFAGRPQSYSRRYMLISDDSYEQDKVELHYVYQLLNLQIHDGQNT